MTNTTGNNGRNNPLRSPNEACFSSNKPPAQPIGENLRMTYSFEGSGPQMEDFGLNPPLYSKLLQAAQETDSIIMIRKTNRGSVIPLDKIGAVGKKLATKGKSSSAYFTNGSITFLGCLAKKVGDAYNEQKALIDILKVATNPTGISPGLQKYTYIPKFISLNPDQWPVPYQGKEADLISEQQGSDYKKVALSKINGQFVHQIETSQRSDELKDSLYILKKVNFYTYIQDNNISIAEPYYLLKKDPKGAYKEKKKMKAFVIKFIFVQMQ